RLLERHSSLELVNHAVRRAPGSTGITNDPLAVQGYVAIVVGDHHKLMRAIALEPRQKLLAMMFVDTETVIRVEIRNPHHAIVDRVGGIDVAADKTPATGVAAEDDAGLSGNLLRDGVHELADASRIVRPFLPPRRPASTDVGGRFQICDDDVF